MKGLAASDVRNFAFMGHTGSGKTTLVDALLFKMGATDRLGSPAAGTSAADFTDEEKSRKISLFAKPFSGVYSRGGKQTGFVFIDTPGYTDFFGQVISATRGADAGVIVVDAAAKVQVGTRRTWDCCERNGLTARAVVITGLDKENTDYAAALEAVTSAFGSKCVPVTIPTADRKAVVDVLAARDVPADLADAVQEAKGKLVELAAETNDSLLEKYLGGEELSAEEIASGLVNAVRSGGLVPVFVCLALKDVGINEFLEGVTRLLPAPTVRVTLDAEGKPIATGEKDPFVGFVWRIMNDPFVGQVTFVRVIGGTLSSDSEIYNTSRDQKERIGSLISLNGKKQEPITRATAGDIVAIPKLKVTTAADTLCAMGQKILCPRITFPKPVAFQAVFAKTQADEDKIGTALQRVCEEDPTMGVDRNKETREMVLQGLGDVHIDVAVGLMKSRSGVEVTLAVPKVPYRETVTALGEGHYKHKKQTGGRGQYGEVYLRVEPKRGEEEEWFVNAVVGGVIPHNFIPAVQKGLVEGMTSGPLAGFPVTNVKCSVYDGSYHEVDSSEIAFKIAGARALKDAMLKARPVLLEPIMTVKVRVPDQYMGDINGDLNHKRGRILGLENEEGTQVVVAEVPQAELFRYSAELRSVTSGQGSFEMEFCRYDVVPSNVAQKIIAAAAKDKKEEED